jgi:chemotaxis protein MotB
MTTMIVIKKVKKAAHGHHGGAWKVAYADFVTAMMAFFLLLWLLNAVSQEQLEGISDYFSPITTQRSTSGGGGLLQGQTVDKKGVFNSPDRDASGVAPPVRRSHSFTQIAPPPDDGEDTASDPAESADDPPPASAAAREAAARRAAERGENAQFEAVEQALEQAIAANPDLKGLAKSVMIDNTPEGLRVQLIDQDRLPMFPRGSAVMYAHTEKLLAEIARVIGAMPQDIEIAGHTDATPYQTGSDYSNWELSADRANAARRRFLQAGLAEGRIARVVGRAATTPLYPEDPKAAGNRRLSVTLLRGTAHKA